MRNIVTRTVVAFGVAALVIGFSVLNGTTVRANTTGTTLENMQTAFNGESNAHARYLVFAAKADAEGYSDVASLFRAASRAEQIHAGNHAVVIRKLGAEPQAKIEATTPKSTSENLQAAIAGESYERDTMYPGFLAVARTDSNKDAVRALNFAMQAEAGHSKLYQAALEGIATPVKSQSQFFVCPVCGRTERARPDGKCPVCFTKASKWETVR